MTKRPAKTKAPAAPEPAYRYTAAVDLYSDEAAAAYPAGAGLTGDEFPAAVISEWLAQGVITARAESEVNNGGG